ncbi:Gag-Pol polyprotein [Smittium culicis]|uniref:Gag-Pol polyprotein n=1 Tax=Smittium culicis TaxID=133412 RepID=A0A1R1YT20_9FUNG|nr:Gag-Pol polyprotein [Smittium culicis]
MKAVPNIQTETVLKFLAHDVVMKYGIPSRLITDRGSNFVSDLALEAYRFLGIDHRPTTAYRPQSNGQIERFNRSIKFFLSKLNILDKNNWDQHLWKSMLSIITTKHRVIGFSTSEKLYGFEMKTPVSWRLDVTNENYEEAINERIFI